MNRWPEGFDPPHRKFDPNGLTPHLRLLDDHVIASIPFVQTLSAFYNRLELPRRDIPSWVVFTLGEWDWDIVDGAHNAFEFEDETVDNAFNRDDSFRWISDFQKFELVAPRQMAQERIMKRMRILSAAAAVEEILGRAKKIRRAQLLSQFKIAEGRSVYFDDDLNKDFVFSQGVEYSIPREDLIDDRPTRTDDYASVKREEVSLEMLDLLLNEDARLKLRLR